MAKKRAFSIDVVGTDKFCEMPASAQNLYFHLGMYGDDDGFVSSPKRIMRSVGASEDDLKLLVLKNFVIPFQSGVIVIVDWLIHNTLKNDRYKETVYLSEKAQLQIAPNKQYTLETSNFQTGNILETNGKHNIT